MKMTYKEFTKKQLEKAKRSDWFDEHGNSVTAMCNRGFWSEVKSQIKSFNRDVVSMVDFKSLVFQLLNLIVLVLMPILYIPMLMLRVSLSRHSAKEEMMDAYKKYVGEDNE